jgi:hypothetical protein
MRVFNDGDKIDVDSMKPTDTVRLDCKDIGYPGVAIDTTHQEIMEMLSEPKKECRAILPQVKRALMNKDIDKMYNEKGEEWQDFCNDVALYYTCRMVVYGTIIPICAVNGISPNPVGDMD